MPRPIIDHVLFPAIWFLKLRTISTSPLNPSASVFPICAKLILSKIPCIPSASAIPVSAHPVNSVSGLIRHISSTNPDAILHAIINPFPIAFPSPRQFTSSIIPRNPTESFLPSCSKSIPPGPNNALNARASRLIPAPIVLPSKSQSSHFTNELNTFAKARNAFSTFGVIFLIPS